ncbi:D-alanyl-D-alanine carboxypeptidase/D-alanyl-D-alanine-endopeptidase [Shewanella avicenniae]|uniref:D-alanyl-D-alanine carboxypeptidase/D-alanyl-D-alanine-endopeptidase n=1 Tax=Shewanella avicenniae TaxID=2814294 RepID=A0ABX7QKM7_9GAMM|nr:D-alanyl-D-alanine carboxypeptidase/D-alanyl-D-alanine-endopeptidase [Shewanella avicenniae]QSX32013.1 D-alanyl-D-alanine carboxypeptidase/D-alanyl-D-alanine-endopeptidase [Shewanella avicenniae]
MINLRRVLAAVLVIGVNPHVNADNANLLQDWQQLRPEHGQVSLILADPQGKRLIDSDSHKLLLPASTQKLLTAVAAATLLGDEFQFYTRLLYRGELKSGGLNGDLIIQFDGDPQLSAEQLGQLLQHLTDAGIKQINGDIIIANNDLAPQWAAGWLWDDLGVCFAAPVGKLVLDQNCVKGSLTANADNSSRLYLRYPLTVSNSAQYQPETPAALCKLHLQYHRSNQYQLSGCYQQKNPLPLEVAIVDPAAYIQAQIKQRFPRHVDLRGSIKIAATDIKDTKALLSFPSMPLRLLIIKMLTKSDNLIADALMKKLGEVKFGQYGFEFGAEAIKQTLEGLGIDLETANIVDGSGLSRYNQLTAAQLFQILLLIQQEPKLNWLISALPVAGESGTLKHKRGYLNPQLRGGVMAKTGSMTGVDNLAGFLRIDEQQPQLYPFVIMENGLSAAAYRPAKFSPPFLIFARNALQQAQKHQVAKQPATSKSQSSPTAEATNRSLNTPKAADN